VIDREIVDLLRRSREIIGEVAAVIIDYDGEVLAGRHRKEAGWTKEVNVDTRVLAEKWGVTPAMAKEMVRLHTNIQRRPSREETQATIVRMAEELESVGVERENVASELVKYVPYDRQYVLELLPEKYKRPEKVRAGRESARVRSAEQPPTLRWDEEKGDYVEVPKKWVSEERHEEPVRPEEPKRTPVSASEYIRPAYTEAELILEEYLAQLGIPYRTQVPIPRGELTPDGKMKTYVVDVLVGNKLVVEVDGEAHDYEKDEERDEFLRSNGYVVEHFPNELVLKYPEFVARYVYMMHRLSEPEEHIIIFRGGKVYHNGEEMYGDKFETEGAAVVRVEVD